MTLDQAEAYARANGDRYHIMRHAQLKAILCLAIIRYGPFADFDNDLFGIHNFWGGIWEWIDGFKVTAPESALRSSAKGLMTGATGWKVRPAGTTYTGFIPLLTSETAHPTEQIDVNFLYANRQIIFGGTGKPPFAFGTVKAGSSKDNIGARLIYV